MTPRSRAVLAAIKRLEESNQRPVANAIAREASKDDATILVPVRRHGNGAVKGSWSGTAADCHRILGSLGALRRAGLIAPVYEIGRATFYTITDEGDEALGRPAPEEAPFELALDVLYPIDDDHRYRIYARRGKDELEVLCSTPTPGGIGVALVQLDDDAREHGQRLVDRGAIGVLDVIQRRWIILPWHRPDGVTRLRETEVNL